MKVSLILKYAKPKPKLPDRAVPRMILKKQSHVRGIKTVIGSDNKGLEDGSTGFIHSAKNFAQ